MVISERRLSGTTSPGVSVLLAFLLAGILAFELAASAMSRLGVHMTPIACIALVGTAIAFTSSGLAQLRLRRLGRSAIPGGTPHPSSESLASAFGRWSGVGEVLDARDVFPEFLFAAEEARLALLPTGATFLAARFPDAAAATEAARGYQEFFGMNAERVDFDGSWFGNRVQTRDFASVRCDGNLLLAWTARERSGFPARIVPSAKPPRGADPFLLPWNDYDQSPCGRGPIPSCGLHGLQ